MAATWTAFAANVAWANSKYMFTLWNGGSNVLRVYRIWLFNNQTSGVTGAVMPPISIRRISAGGSGGTAVTPVAHDTNSSALSSVTCTHNTTSPTVVSTYRTILMSSDEPAIGAGTIDELETVPALMCVWDAGYGDTNIEPIVLRANQGITLQAGSAASNIGNIDICVEFTNSAS